MLCGYLKLKAAPLVHVAVLDDHRVDWQRLGDGADELRDRVVDGTLVALELLRGRVRLVVPSLWGHGFCGQHESQRFCGQHAKSWSRGAREQARAEKQAALDAAGVPKQSGRVKHVKKIVSTSERRREHTRKPNEEEEEERQLDGAR